MAAVYRVIKRFVRNILYENQRDYIDDNGIHAITSSNVCYGMAFHLELLSAI
jgi:hypothetical protein